MTNRTSKHRGEKKDIRTSAAIARIIARSHEDGGN